MDEMFYLYNNSDIKNISIKNSSTPLRLWYRNYKNEEEIVYGKIGLNMNDNKEITCPRFFYSLKIRYILEKYNYFFDFYSDFHGYFFIGPEPHSIKPKSNINKEFQYIKMNAILSKGGYNNWTLLFNKIIIIDKLDNITYNLNDKAIQFDFNLGLIIGTSEYQKFIEKNYFNNLISEKICNKTLVQYSFDNNNVNHYYIYKCSRIFMNGENFDKEKYRPYINYFELFPDFHLFHVNMEHNFYLTNFDLFKLIRGYYYFLIIFEADKQNDIWKFGQTFLRGHELVFSYDSKTIGYYDRRIQPPKNDSGKKIPDNKTEPEQKDSRDITNNNNSNSSYVYIIVIVVLCVIVILAFYLGMKFKESRKKRANELRDDYEYNTYDNNEERLNNNHIINNE
jgi:hypothetical protein